MSEIKSLLIWAKNNLKEKTVTPKSFNRPIRFTTKGVKEYLNQPHKYYQAKNDIIKMMLEIVFDARYVGKTSYHKDNNYIIASHIFEIEINNEKTWLITRESVEGVVNFYSISDSEKVLIGLKK